MLFEIVAKLLALYLCYVAVNGLDGISNEYVNDDRISRLSDHIESLKNLLDRSPRYNNNYGRQSLWPNIYNRETDYEVYLKQYYIEPILHSLKEITERLNIIIPTNNRPQSFYSQFPGNFETSYGPRFPPVEGWGQSEPSYYSSHGISGDSSHFLSFPLNENTSSNGTAGPQPLGIPVPSTVPLYTKKFEVGLDPNFPTNTPPRRFYSDFDPKVPSNTQSNKFDVGFGSAQYGQSHSYDSGSTFTNKQFLGFDKTYGSGQRTYANSNPPSIANRYPADDDEDTGKNWGIVDDSDEDKDKTRPLSLNSKTNAQSNCNCETHNDKSAKSIQLSRTVPKSAVTCKAVVLSCCAPGVTEKDRRNCFASQGCVRSYDTGLACLPVVVHAVYKELYANV